MVEDLGLNPEIVNVNGVRSLWDIRQVTPVARILTTLLYEMKRYGNVQCGLATLCGGVGQGEATIIDRIE